MTVTSESEEEAVLLGSSLAVTLVNRGAALFESAIGRPLFPLRYPHYRPLLALVMSFAVAFGEQQLARTVLLTLWAAQGFLQSCAGTVPKAG